MNTNYPCTTETIQAFYSRVSKPNKDIPSIPLTEENVRDLETIWQAINELSLNWKKKGFCVPKEPTESKAFWGEFAKKHNGDKMPLLQEFIDQSQGKGKVAIDLGCGKGEMVKPLLEKGWTVIAVDFSEQALEVLSKNNKPAIDSGQLTVIKANINKYKPELAVDLVICKNVLPYINPGKFKAMWEKIPSFLKTNGVFIGSIGTSSSHPDQLIEMNKVKEVGGWFLPDRRMVRPLLEEAGYKVEKCIFHKNLVHLEPKDQILIHFQGKKL